MRPTIFLLALLQAGALRAAPHGPSYDARMVDRAELIVVGRLEGAVRRVPQHDYVPEYHVSLVVDRVIRGSTAAPRIPIVIRGLEVRVVDESFKDLPRPPRGTIVLTWSYWEAHNGSMNLLWFLERDQRGALATRECESVQDLSRMSYFRALLAPDRIGALRDYAAKNPDLAWRAERTIEQIEVDRIVALPDPMERARQLVPYFARRFELDARRAILAVGEPAAPLLEPLYERPTRDGMRMEIVEMWGEMRYRASVDRLIGELQRPETSARDAYVLAIALGRIKDPRARPALQAARRRWAAVKRNDDAELAASGCKQALEGSL